MFKFLGKKIRSLFKGKIDESTVENLEKLFYEADLGNQIATDLTEHVRKLFKKNHDLTSDQVLDEIKKALLNETRSLPSSMINLTTSPYVIMIVGTNGNGKTTTVAKLAHHFRQQNKRVLIAAADTFRTAAIEQLEIWAQRVGAELVKGKPASDAAAVVFDAIEAAKSRKCDVVLVDTAGRLHTKTDLMKELEKIRKVCSKALEGAPHETLLVLDATIGQNALEQAKIFHQFTPLTGLILTKVDGTAKGGIVLSIQKNLQLPVKFLGTGEQIDALQKFDAEEFTTSLFEV